MFEIAGPARELGDLPSILALHAALAEHGDFACLHVGPALDGNVDALIANPHCRQLTCVETGDPSSLAAELAQAPGADMAKLSVHRELPPPEAAAPPADICFLDAQGSDSRALEYAMFARRALDGHGVIVLRDRTLINSALLRFLRRSPGCRAYPLKYDLFVIEIGFDSLLANPAVMGRLPRPIWPALTEGRAARLALRAGPAARRLESVFWRSVLPLAAPRRRPKVRDPSAGATPNLSGLPTLAVCTFVTDEALYDRMRSSFVAAGFDQNSFVRLSDRDEDPYGFIDRIGRSPLAMYTILCHQDVRANRGDGIDRLLASLRKVDACDPDWVVAGNAGVNRRGQGIRQLTDPAGGPSGDSLPASVVTLDENFLVFNARNAPRSSRGLSGFHFYGTDVSLHALEAGGSCYVIDFHLTHFSSGSNCPDYDSAKRSLVSAWSQGYVFRYVLTPTTALFMSRISGLRRVFGSSVVLAEVENARRHHGNPRRGDDPRRSRLWFRPQRP